MPSEVRLLEDAVEGKSDQLSEIVPLVGGYGAAGSQGPRGHVSVTIILVALEESGPQFASGELVPSIIGVVVDSGAGSCGGAVVRSVVGIASGNTVTSG